MADCRAFFLGLSGLAVLASACSAAPDDSDATGEVQQAIVENWCLDNDIDGYPRSTICVLYDGPPAYNWVVVDGSTQYDCVDTNGSINPGATEACNGIDDNCNAQTDEGCTFTTWCLDNDGDTYPRSTSCVTQLNKPAYNWLATTGSTQYDCNDSYAFINPGATEICNAYDDNCNGQVNEGVTLTWYLDGDGDGYPRSTGGYQSCNQPASNWIATTGPFDCNDTYATISPGVAEVCGNSVDENCDGELDTDCLPSSCSNGTQDGNETGTDCGGFCNVCSNGPAPTSCSGLAKTCGPGAGDNCCKAVTVYGADYFRSYDGTAQFPNQTDPATVNSLRLDSYEVSVGRFRKFVQAYDTWRAGGNPAAGAGSHPLISGSGWDATWPLAADAATLGTNLNCGTFPTWTSSAGSNEAKPINCVNWFEAAAFCAWDGGRLPTEAEWNLAAATSEQRAYPWSVPPTDTTLTTTQASYGCLLDGNAACSTADIARVGQVAGGISPDLVYDLSGNVWEWTLDGSGTYPNPCTNCAQLTAAQFRVARGGSWQGTASQLRSGWRGTAAPPTRFVTIGLRCARGG